MRSSNALIIFIKNPLAGKVKTRLAKTIGDEAALKIYEFLLEYTRTQSHFVQADKYVFYDTFIPENDEWQNEGFIPAIQRGENLGDRLLNSFTQIFDRDYEKVVVIGSDCLDITAEIISRSFVELNSYDVIIGPAKDGGYYLLGMNSLLPEIFEDMPWSTNKLLQKTLLKAHSLNLKIGALELLSDIDEEKDLMNINLHEKI